MAGSSKRVRYVAKDFEEFYDGSMKSRVILSDVNSISDDECINSEHESNSTLSEISDESEKNAII
jgi:hypothetical protein